MASHDGEFGGRSSAASIPGGAATTPLRSLALLFLRLGLTAFGGPAAHIAMLREEVVRRRGWLSEQQFLDLLGATQLIPGPNSTEMAIHIGWARRRWAGLLVAGLGFIVPATLLTGALAWAYLRFGSLPEVAWVFEGTKPLIVAIVAQALWSLTPTAAPTWPLRWLGIGAVLASALGTNELLVLFGGGAATFAAWRLRRRHVGGFSGAIALVPLAGAGAPTLLPGASTLFWIFCKIGAVLFGSGYVLLAFLRAEFVVGRQWLSEGQLLDAVAAGQLTPGPVFSTATFLGYLLAGPGGALAATAGIFLPAFAFVALSAPFVSRLRAWPGSAALLDGLNVASLALMAVVAARLARHAIIDAPTALMAGLGAVLSIRYRVPSVWLLLGGALLGAAFHVSGLAGWRWH